MPSSDEEKPDTRAGATAGKAHAAQLAQLELRVSELELRLARWQQRLVTVSIVMVSTLLFISACLSFGSTGRMCWCRVSALVNANGSFTASPTPHLPPASAPGAAHGGRLPTAADMAPEAAELYEKFFKNNPSAKTARGVSRELGPSPCLGSVLRSPDPYPPPKSRERNFFTR